jgi:hypothetical protein
LSVGVTLMFFIIIWWDLNNSSEEIVWKYTLTGITIFFLSISVSILSESLKFKVIKRYLSQVVVLIFWALFYYFFPNDIDIFDSIVFFLLTLFWIVASLFIAPYLKYLYKLDYDEQSYYIYFYKISIVFFLSFIVGWALTLLWNIAILTVTTLFDIWYNFWWDIHGYWTALALSFLTPCFALIQIVEKCKFEEKHFNENAFFHFFIRYIALPFIYIYFIILYAYTLKVLIDFSDWPKGEVSWMVIWFSTFWYIIYIYSYIFEQWEKQKSHNLVHIFRKYFPIIVIPQIWMLFYAISLRIGQYDFTINRYFVVVFGIWLLLSSIYLIVSKKKSLLFLPALLVLFTIIISIGPWSVYNFPLERQLQRLENNLIQANILQNWEIIPLEKYSDIDADLSGEIYSWIDYLCNFNNCDTIKELFPKLHSELLEKTKKDFESNNWNKEGYYDTKYSEPNSWEIRSYISDKIKVKRSNSWDGNQPTIYFYNPAESIYPLDVVWYDTIITYNSRDLNSEMQDINVSDIYKNLLKIYTETSSIEFSIKDRTFTIENDDYTWKLIILNAQIFKEVSDRKKENWYTQEYLEGIVLLKKK